MKLFNIFFLLFSLNIRAGNGDGTLPALKTIAIVIDDGAIQSCKVLPVKTQGLKKIEKTISTQGLVQKIGLQLGASGQMNLSVKPKNGVTEVLRGIIANNEEVISVQTSDKLITETILLSNDDKALKAFLQKSGCQ